MRAVGIVAVFALIAAALWAGPVRAAIIVSVDQGILSVVGDDEPDNISVECEDGQVIVSGNPPASAAAACDSIISIVVTSGGGDDDIRLIGVRPNAYPSVAGVSVDAGSGKDQIIGSGFVDTIDAGTGRDYVEADPTAGDVLEGGSNRDTAVWRFAGELSVTDTTVVHSSGSLSFTGFEFIRLHGGPGRDRLDASAFSGLVGIDGGKGNDRLIVGGSPNRFFNVVEGGAGNDVLVGGSGRDDLDGRAGVDELFGRAGPDSLNGGVGDDRIFAGAGNDDFYMVTGADVASGGAGRDDLQILIPVRGGLVRGGPGIDTAQAYFQGELVLGRRSVESRSGQLLLRSIDILSLIATRFEPSRLDGRRYRGDLRVSVEAIYPFYDDGSITALGGWGNDSLFGSPGDDVLSGGPGRDELDGQGGIDECDGGPGRDRIFDCE